MGEKVNLKKDQWDDKHRPWPLPRQSWNMLQTWRDLLFVHYPISLNVLRQLVPEGLQIDTFDGTGWIGIVPFQMTDIRLRGLPSVPGTSQFPELNVRTYVTVDGKPGVYFFSLDAPNRLAVWVANTNFHLPYKYSFTKMESNGPIFDFENKRKNNESISFHCSYKPISDAFSPPKGTFEEWMSERYCFYTMNKQGVALRCDIHHQPWELQHAEAECKVNTMLSNQNIPIDSNQPIYHFAKHLDVRIYPLVRVFE